jgi:hypothetical protein
VAKPPEAAVAAEGEGGETSPKFEDEVPRQPLAVRLLCSSLQRLLPQ